MQRIQPGYAAETTPVARATWPCVQHDPPHERQNPFREKLGFVCKGFNLAMLQRQHRRAGNTTHLTQNGTHFARNLVRYAKDSTWLCYRDKTRRASNPALRATRPIPQHTSHSGCESTSDVGRHEERNPITRSSDVLILLVPICLYLFADLQATCASSRARALGICNGKPPLISRATSSRDFPRYRGTRICRCRTAIQRNYPTNEICPLCCSAPECLYFFTNSRVHSLFDSNKLERSLRG
jgi:hypothetical protein